MLKYFSCRKSLPSLAPAGGWSELPSSDRRPPSPSGRRLLSLVLGAFALLVAANCPAADDGAEAPPVSKDARTYRLRYKFEPNETIRTEVVHRATVETTIQGTNQTAETRSMSVKAWKITGVNARGDIRFVHSVENIDMWQHTTGRQEVRFNSQTDKQPPPGYEDAAKAVGVPLAVVIIDQHGRVLKRENLHPQPNVQQAQLVVPLPKNAARIGHKWAETMDIEVLVKGGATRKVQCRQQYTLAAVKNGVAVIKVETQVMTPINDPTVEAQLIQRLFAGTIRFDVDRGRLLSQQMDLDRRVIGFSGASSSMHYLTRFTEKLMSDEEVAEHEQRQLEVRRSVRRANKTETR